MVDIQFTGDALWDRIERAVERVRNRLRRVTQALESAGIPYAVVGGNAVQIWAMLSVGLIDASWLTRLPASLADRLQELIDSPQ